MQKERLTSLLLQFYGKEELNLMYGAVKERVLASFDENPKWLWTFSEVSRAIAWIQNFIDGRQGYNYKADNRYVRGVRSF